MLKNKYSILAGAVLAALPAVGKAVVITFSYDPSTILVNGSPAVLGGTAAAPTITAPQGAVISFGVDAIVQTSPLLTQNPAFGDAYAVAHATTATQVQYLGLAAYSFGFGTGTKSNATLDAGGLTYNDGTQGGDTEGSNANNATSGGIDIPNIGIAEVVGSINAGKNLASAGVMGYAADNAAHTPTQLFSGLNIDVSPTATGSTQITSTFVQGGINQLQYIAYNSGGTTTVANAPPVYKQIIASATDPNGADTINALPALTVIVQSAVTTGATHQAIISLTSGSTPVPSYGPADGALALTGQGNGSYNVVTATSFNTAATGSVAVTGFHPSTDTEIYALKLTNASAGTFTAGQLATIIADINGTGTGSVNNASTGLVASTITGVFATEFPAAQGYNVLLTATGVTNPAELGFDFSAVAEQDPSAPAGITVTGVAAVPEPATAAGIVLGAAGLLLGRRRNKLQLA